MKNRYMTPVQGFAFGGIANPVQRAMLRGSDKGFLDARQKELDAFEAQRQAYNTALQDYQTKVYEPYQQQATAYNTAAQQYNEEVYNPYQTQYDAYAKAVEAYNAGDRLADYSGPAEPTLARGFEMQAPTAPTEFTMQAPALPFKEEEVQKFQQEAAGRARTDAAGRAVAIDVVSDPDRFNFGSMSVANRFMAEGGPVEKTAREQLDDMSAPEDAAITRMLAEMQAGGNMDRDALREAVSRVAQAGRGGDELLAHLSPESREVLMRMGGSGTVNPLTGLPEFFIGALLRGLRKAFSSRSSSPAPAPQAPPPPPTAAEQLASYQKRVNDLQSQLKETPETIRVRRGPLFFRRRTVGNPAYANLNSQLTTARAQLDEFMKTYKPAPAPAAPAPLPMSIAATTPAAPAPLPMSIAATTPAAPAPAAPAPLPMSIAAITPAALAPVAPPPPPPPPVPRDAVRAPGVIGSQASSVQLQAPPQLSAVGAATPLPQLNLSGNVGSSVSGAPGSSATAPGSVPGGPANSAMGSIPTSGPAIPDYSSRGVGAVGDIGGISVQGPAMPTFGNTRLGGAATSPSSYFSMVPQTSTGLAPGSAAIGPADMPVYGAMNTMGALGANSNLSPGMLGGQQNAGMFTDRLGNRIYSPSAATLYGFAKGGAVDLEALARQNAENLSDEESEEAINTNPVGTAQQMLADLAGTERSSPTRMAVKRTKTSAGGGASADKSMRMGTESLAKGDLGAMKETAAPKGAPESARAQMEELARVYQLRMTAAKNKARGLSADTFGAPTLEGSTLTKNTLAKKRFAKGGEAKKSEAAETGERLAPQQETAEDSGLLSRLFGGSKEDPLKGIKNKAEQNSDYRAMLQYLQSRDAVPEIKSGYLPDPIDAVFSSANLPLIGAIGKGQIKINREIRGPEYETFLGPSTLAHEMTHATDRQLQEQAGEQSGMFSKGNRFTDAYEKLVGPGGMREGKKRLELAQKYYPKFVSGNRSYRALPSEIAAHGVGKYAGPTTADDAPPHVDATAATEFQILLDLARRNSGDPKKRAKGSPEEGEVSQAELDAASRPAFVTPKSGIGRKSSTKAGDLEAAALQGISETPYNLLGAPVDLLTMAMRPFGYSTEAPMLGSEDLKRRATKAGIRQEPPKEGTAARALFNIAEIGSSAVNPAAPVRAGMKAAKAVGDKATDVAKDFQEYNRQLTVPGASYAVPPQGPTKTPAPASGLGFYSAAEQAALNLPRKEGSGAAFLNDLMKAPDVKKEELSAMGLDEFLRGKPKATRQEVQDFIASNRIDVREVQLGGNVVEDPAGLAKRKAVFDKYEPEILGLYKQMDAAPGDQSLMDKALEIQFRRDREADAAYVIPEPLPTRFERPSLVLPGGENYREILLTMPTRGKDELDAAQVAAGNLRRQTADLMEQWKATSELNPGAPNTVALYQKVTESRKLRDQAEAKAQALKDQISSNTYQSSHFNEPNILAHMRVNDRVDADGKKMLLIEELQSDWHQAGREKGYKNKTGKYGEKVTDEEYKRGADLQNRQRLGEPLSAQEETELSDIMSRHMESLERDRVPDAPFKDTWHQLALKRALKYAADNGYERVGLTTGKQQSQRYNLGTQVDHISYEPTKKGFYINVISKDGPNVLNGDYSAKELEGIVGKELTQKMLAKQGKNEFNPEIEPDLAEVRRLDGVDLQLEDKGMKKYYDEIYPTFLAKQAKKYGSQVGETRIKTQTSAPAYVDYIVGRGNFTDTTVLGVRADGSTEIINQNPNSLQEAQQLANRYKEKHLGGGEPVRYIDIAPGMKDAVPYAKGGAVDKNTAFIQAHS